MSELKDQLRTYFETIATPVHANTSAAKPWWRLRPLAAALVGAAVVAVPILVMWGLFGRAVQPQETVPPATTIGTETTQTPDTATPIEEVTSTTTHTAATTVPPAETTGAWTMIPDAPWAYPHTVRAWTGIELLVFPEYAYGLEAPATGMAYSPSNNEWRNLAPAPELRGQPASVWTGSHLLVWGGTVAEGVDGFVLSNTGFAYDPATDSWSAIPPAPLDPQTYPFHVWTGRELIVWGGSTTVDDIFLGGTTDGAAYDPVTSQWREIADSPLGARNPGVGIWTGSEMIIGGNGDHTDGDASWAAYDPLSDTWRAIPEPPVRAGLVYSAVWTGTEVIFHKSSDVYALDPANNDWRQASPSDQLLDQAGSTWTGSQVIYWGDTGRPGLPQVAQAYDPASDSWAKLASSPLRDRFADGNPTLIAPATILIWGGTGYELVLNADGAILTLDTPPVAGLATTAADIDLVSELLRIGPDPSIAAELPWDPDGVSLGLGETIVKTLDPADASDPAKWLLEVAEYGAGTGPFSAHDRITELAALDDITVQVGPHNHCIAASRAAPPGFESMRRISVQPSTADCLQWFTIDLFVTDDNLISAVIYDIWEP